MPAFDRVLVTGAGGFVGRHLLSKLRTVFPTAELIAAVRPEDGVLPQLNATHVVQFDLLEPDQCEEMIATIKPDGLVHLAAQASVKISFTDPMATWQANLLGTITLAEAVKKHVPHCRFILASSAEIYGLSFRAPTPLDESALLCPTNPYAASKAACDIAVGELALRGLNAVRLRAFNHTGAGQSDNFVIAAFARQIARMEAGQQEAVLHVGALDRWRDFLDVFDVCDAYAAALSRKTAPGTIYNISSGKPRRIGDILEAFIARTSVKPRIEIKHELLRPSDVERVAGDPGRAHSELDWRPTIPWDRTLDTVLNDWRQRIV